MTTVTGEGLSSEIRRLMNTYDYEIDDDGQIVIYTGIFIALDEE